MDAFRMGFLLIQILLIESLENLALNKTATGSLNCAKNLWRAEAAVDGQFGQTANRNTCACTKVDSNYVAWWKVDLGDVYSVSNVNIVFGDTNYMYPGFSSSLNLYVTVGDNFLNSSTVYDSNRNKDVNIYTPSNITLTLETFGQYVTLYFLPMALPFIIFCEVEVLGCTKNKYGDKCQNDCPENCLYDVCTVSNGTCYGCKAGYTGDRCDQPCGAGTYGVGCSQNCSVNCDGGGSCDAKDGTCRDDCADGFNGPNCNEILQSDQGMETAIQKIKLQFIIYGAISATVILLLLILVLLLVLRGKCQSRASPLVTGNELNDSVVDMSVSQHVVGNDDRRSSNERNEEASVNKYESLDSSRGERNYYEPLQSNMNYPSVKFKTGLDDKPMSEAGDGEDKTYVELETEDKTNNYEPLHNKHEFKYANL